MATGSLFNAIVARSIAGQLTPSAPLGGAGIALKPIHQTHVLCRPSAPPSSPDACAIESSLGHALLRRFLAGDGPSARLLTAEVSAIIERRAGRALRRRSAATGYRDASQEVEDLRQEVLLRLLDGGAAALRRWDPARNIPLSHFITVIVDREISSIFRRRRRNPWGEDPTDLHTMEALAGPATSLDDHLEARATLRTIIHGARARLQGRGQDMLEWLIIDLRPTGEVCRISGLSRDAVYAWRSRLQRLLTEVAGEICLGERGAG